LKLIFHYEPKDHRNKSEIKQCHKRRRTKQCNMTTKSRRFFLYLCENHLYERMTENKNIHVYFGEIF